MLICTVPGCRRCRRAKQWLRQNQISFEEVPLYAILISERLTEKLAGSAAGSPMKDFCSSCFLQSPSELKKHPSLIGRPMIWVEPEWLEEPENQQVLAELLEFCRPCSKTCRQKEICSYSHSDPPVSVLAAEYPEEISCFVTNSCHAS